MNDASVPASALRGFRERFYGCLRRRADALFEVADAVLTAGRVPSPPHLSLAAMHRRGWGSLYAALSQGRIDGNAVRDLLARHPMLHEDRDRTSVYAVDVTSWPRCDAESSPERGYYYHPSRHSAGQPIVAGWAYQLIAEIGFARDTWVAPMDVRRVLPAEDANDVAAEQVRILLGRMHLRGDAAAPLFVFDAGYDPVKLQRRLGELPLQLLVRLHSNRVFYADPETPEKRPVGRPHRHGARFDLHDPATWPEPSCEHSCETEDYGPVRVRAWSELHPKTRRIGERYGCERAPVVKGTVILVEVSRLPKEARKPKKLWMWWVGEGEPELDLIWRSYCRRFSLEHAIKFMKLALGWTTPRVRHPEQADRWSWLILAAYTQLRLARGIVADRRLPWEKPLSRRRLTPTRVLRAFCGLLPGLGTPAEAPKPRGRSPGRPKGSLSGPARRYPAIKKAA
jgi:DDE superfamily endonuclease